jgi:Concanavalin A-like lectin/glucanases superfamily
MKKIFIIILFIAQHIKSDAQVTMPDFQAMQYVSSNFGNALNFDGTSTYGLGKAYVTDSLLDFTIEFWIKNTGTDGTNDRIYGSYFNDALQIGKSSTQLKLKATDLGGPDWQSVCTLESNIWVHIALIRSGTTLKVYKNAGLVQTYTVDGTSTLPSFFRLGSNINGAGENGNFSIDELRIWKIALATTPTNFIQKYMYSPINPNSTADANPSTKLVLYYRFDQGIVGASNASELGIYNSAISN